MWGKTIKLELGDGITAVVWVTGTPDESEDVLRLRALEKLRSAAVDETEKHEAAMNDCEDFDSRVNHLIARLNFALRMWV